MQQLLFGGELGLVLGGDLADQDVAGLDQRADAHEAALVEVAQGFFRATRDFAGELFLAELGLADLDLELLDVDRGEAVFDQQALIDDDRVFEVVAVEGHERDEDVLAERELALVGTTAVGDDLTLDHLVARTDDRLLVQAGAFVEALVLAQRIDARADGDLLGVDRRDGAFLFGDDDHRRGLGDLAFHAGGDDRRLGDEQGHGLAHHVRTHEGAVGVVVLEEGDQRGGNADHLLRRDVGVGHFADRDFGELAGKADLDDVVLDLAVGVGGHRRLGDLGFGLFIGHQVVDVLGDDAVDHLAVGRREESVLVDGAVDGERNDQADVGAFRGFDRADATVVRRMHVAHFEAGTLAVQTARPEGRQATLVRQLREQVRLVDDLRQLAALEEVLDRAVDRLVVEQVARSESSSDVFLLEVTAELLLDRTTQLEHRGAQLVAEQVGDRTHAAVAEMVDVVELAGGAVRADQRQQVGQGRVVVLDGEDARLAFELELAVDTEAADGAEVVARLVEEAVLEELADLGLVGGIARAQATIDAQQRFLV